MHVFNFIMVYFGIGISLKFSLENVLSSLRASLPIVNMAPVKQYKQNGSFASHNGALVSDLLQAIAFLRFWGIKKRKATRSANIIIT